MRQGNLQLYLSDLANRLERENAEEFRLDSTPDTLRGYAAEIPLTPIEYQTLTRTTAIYPEWGEGTFISLSYCALGAAGKAGEIANKVKKILRDEVGQVTPERRDAILGEIRGTLWYLGRLCDELGADLGEQMALNISELASRKDRSTLHGDGDTR